MNQIHAIQIDENLFPLVIIKWKVNIDQIVKKDEELAIIEVVEDGEARRRVVKSKLEGRIVKLADTQTVLESGSLVGEIEEECSHAVQLHGLCAVCGKDLTIADYTGSETSRATINMTHDSRGVKISHNEATRIEEQHISRLLKAKKLSMLLDLDQTVVHATVDDQVRGWLEEPDNPNFPAISEVSSFTLPDSPIVYYIKLRPGTRQFLEKMYEKYEMHIYTMGTRNYAHAVANILDPTKKYFKDRILSRDDSGSFIHKSIQRLFPVDQSMVVAIDDRADVWHWSPNLIKVRPYNFFLGIGDINEPMKEEDSGEVPTPVTGDLPKEDKAPKLNTAPIVSMTIIQPDTQTSTIQPIPKAKPILADNDQDLEYLSNALSNLHQQYFKIYSKRTPKADVATILPSLKLKVLEGVHLVFSGVIPLGVDPSLHDIWILASHFGAKCYLEITSTTTHLIAKKTGTVKVREAREMQCFVVKPEWLHDCIIQWRHLPEQDYTLDPNFKVQKVEVGKSTWTDLDKELAELSSDSGSQSETRSVLGSESFDGLDDAIEAEMEDLKELEEVSSTKRKFDTI